MRRLALTLTAVALVAGACGNDTGEPTTSPTTSTFATTTSGPGSSTAAPTTAAPPTSSTSAGPPSTVPNAYPVEEAAYCVRGTDPSDALNVRAGPGVGYEVVGRLAWDAVAVPAGGRAAPDEQGRIWLEVEHESGMGWAAGWYLEPAPCEAAVADPAPLAGAGFPDALSGGLVPWARVDQTWALALYSPAWESPRALYLLSPYGDVYEVFTWPGDDATPFHLYDWRPDGRGVLTAVGMSEWPEIHFLDLETRSATTVMVNPLPLDHAASFTSPTGRDLVLRTGDEATERVEVRYLDGSLFSTLLEQPRSPEWIRQASWIYGLDGITVVVGDGVGLRLLTNRGEAVRDLDAPGVACRPVRWWDPSTVLARCLAPEVLAYQPYGYYGRLWLVPADGSAAAPLTALPAGEVDVVDFGFFDAWQVGGTILANWGGDCSAADIRRILPDGTSEAVSSNQIIGLLGSAVLVRRWTACDQQDGSLHLIDANGNSLREVLAGPSEGPGVVDALMMQNLP